jgi:hypothetical protein
MTSEEVLRLVEGEISGLLPSEWSLTPAQRLELRKGLLPPQLRNYYDCGDASPEDPPAIIRLWLVSEGLSGCNIVYGEDAGMFGLAVAGRSPLEVSPEYFSNLTQPESGVDTFIGYYGGFLETYFSI